MTIHDSSRTAAGDLGDISTEELRRHGHAVVEQVAAYLSSLESRPVLAAVQPGALRDALPATPPEHPEALEQILADVDRLIVPGLTHWQAPGFMAYFGTTGSVPGILGEMLTAGFNSNAMLWRTSPAATELEQVTLDWLRQLLGLPGPLFGCINDTASASTLYALAAAREAIPGAQIRERGLAGRSDIGRLRYYASEEAHSSVEKAGIVLGTGREGLRRIATDSAYRMDAGALEQAIAEDRAAGWLPFAVVATVGTTSTTSVDPVAAIADVCEREALWLHVDAAYGGTAAVVPELRWVLDGCDRADSLVVNPHKWLFTPLDCSVLYTRRPEVLRDAFSLVPEYLTSSQDDHSVVNFMDYGVSLGRRFRALKLWMVLRAFGAEGIAARLREHVRLAAELAAAVDGAAGWERLAPAPLSVVCLRARPAGVDDESELDALNGRILDGVNAGGRFFLSHTRLRGRYAIRVAIGNLHTAGQHVRGVWDELIAAAAQG
ncbi:MAG TPA: pyridoxal-dependent decarboxylase [Candidatus Dormibacteraeota bacterium]|jgi:aromatic-L-amino-acid decarboxylase|nr:pyridoxal-dependent decarboxylase [Candidatus Dormibacteraeota bacterium]